MRTTLFALWLASAMSVVAQYPERPPTVAAAAALEEIYRGGDFYEGPTWEPVGGRLFFTAFGKAEAETAIMAWSEKTGRTIQWADQTEGTNGTHLAPDGTLLGAQAFRHRIVGYTLGAADSVSPARITPWLVEPGLHQPNDVTMHQDGFIYFSDPDFAGRKKGGVYRFVRGGVAEALPGELILPNGLEISDDGKLLVVGDSHTRRWYAYDLQPGQPIHEIKPPRVFFDPPGDFSSAHDGGLPDGMTLDAEGNFYFTGLGGVWCVDRAAKARGFLPVPEFPSNVCFGGNDGKWLFVTCQDAVYRLRMKVGGAPGVQPLNCWNNGNGPRDPLLTHHVYRSVAMQTDVGYTLWLPPAYKAEPELRFPVLYWLHGLGGSENGGAYPVQALAEGIAAGTLPPVILVNVNGGARSVFADSADGRWLAETTIIRELIPHLDATYRTIARREGRAIQGMSMGGEGAVRLAVKYPGLFSSAIGYAGGYVLPGILQQFRPRIYAEMFASDPALCEKFLAHTAIRDHAAAVGVRLPIRLICGTADDSLRFQREIEGLLKKFGLPHEAIEVPGAPHDLPPLLTRPGGDDLLWMTNAFSKK